MWSPVRVGVGVASGVLLAGCSGSAAPRAVEHTSGHISSAARFTVSPSSGPPGTLVTLVMNGCDDPTGDSHTFGYNAVGDLQLNTMEQQQFYPNAVWAIPGRVMGTTMRAKFIIPANAPRPVGSFNAQCLEADRTARFKVTGRMRGSTLLAVIVRSARIPGGFRLVVAPARFTDGQYLRIRGRATETYDVASPLVPDPSMVLSGSAVEVTTQGSKVVNVAIVGG